MSEASAILEPAATRIRDPHSGRSVWMAGMIQEAELRGNSLRFKLALGQAHSEEDGQRIQAALLENIGRIGFGGTVDCKLIRSEAPAKAPAPSTPTKAPLRGMSGGGTGPHGGPLEKKPIPGVKHIVAVASGKGGVGKSTVSTNLAVALSQQGLQVGLMDADIYGPSLPTMMNVNGKPMFNDNKKITPLEAYGVRCMSMGFLVPEKEAIIWRGPMVMGAVKQFLHDVDWGELDVLIIDLPPGTGDADLVDPHGRHDRHDACDFLVPEKLRPRNPIQALLGHAVDATIVAPVGHTDTQVVVNATERILERRVLAHASPESEVWTAFAT